MIRLPVALAALCLSCPSTHAAGIEHWTCDMTVGTHPYRQDWTLADNRMFAPKGKGDLHLAYNSPSVAVAYQVHKQGDSAVTYMWVFDKTGGQAVEYDDMGPALMKGPYGVDDPDVKVVPCRRVD